MLTKPDLKEESIITCLYDSYGLDSETVSFLPLGADFHTAVYRVTTREKIDFFLKLRSGDFCEPSVLIPYHLKQIGSENMIPALAAITGQLWAHIASYTAILYPYVDGHNGLDTKLSAQHWHQLGSTLKTLHTLEIPESIADKVPKETFPLTCCQTVRFVLDRIKNEVFEETAAAQLATLLKSKTDIILDIIKRTEELGVLLQKQSFDYVICHADIHGWNLLIDPMNHLYLIDWDTLVFAPKERDLMFFGAGIWNSGYTPKEEESLFYKGYGQAKINQDVLCYYRFQRILQDIAEYCEYIFLSAEGDEHKKDDRLQMLEYLRPNFLPNGTIERAYDAYHMRTVL